jgi:hypothetical protein
MLLGSDAGVLPVPSEESSSSSESTTDPSDAGAVLRCESDPQSRSGMRSLAAADGVDWLPARVRSGDRLELPALGRELFFREFGFDGGFQPPPMDLRFVWYHSG